MPALLNKGLISDWAEFVVRVQENNFKAVLESIRDLMNEETVLPDWLHDIFLGYGDPAAAQYSQLPTSYRRTLDFKVTSLAPTRSIYIFILALSVPSAAAAASAPHLGRGQWVSVRQRSC